MTSQKATNLGRSVWREDGVAVSLVKVAMKVKFGASRIDEQLSGAVTDEEGDVQRFFGDFLPLVTLAVVALDPCGRAVQKARYSANRGGQRVRTSRHTADFDQPEGGATDSRSWCVKDKALAGEQRKSAYEEVKAASNRNCREKHQLVGQWSE